MEVNALLWYFAHFCKFSAYVHKGSYGPLPLTPKRRIRTHLEPVVRMSDSATHPKTNFVNKNENS